MNCFTSGNSEHVKNSSHFSHLKFMKKFIFQISQGSSSDKLKSRIFLCELLIDFPRDLWSDISVVKWLEKWNWRNLSFAKSQFRLVRIHWKISTTTIFVHSVSSKMFDEKYSDLFKFSCQSHFPDDKQGSPVQRNTANARERARMRVLSSAFYRLKTIIPWVPHDTKLSKLDTLRLARNYITHLSSVLDGKPANEITNKLPYPQKMVIYINCLISHKQKIESPTRIEKKVYF